jgi:hypothetical protein
MEPRRRESFLVKKRRSYKCPRQIIIIFSYIIILVFYAGYTSCTKFNVSEHCYPRYHQPNQFPSSGKQGMLTMVSLSIWTMSFSPPRPQRGVPCSWRWSWFSFAVSGSWFSSSCIGRHGKLIIVYLSMCTMSFIPGPQRGDPLWTRWISLS